MEKVEYDLVLKEMNEALIDFSKKSDQLNAYEYEKQFRELTDYYNALLFQVSVGKVPASKNQRLSIQTSFGDIDVKKNTL